MAGDECHRERLSDLLEVTQSANDWTPSAGLLPTPSAGWPSGALPECPTEILWTQLHLDPSSSTWGPGPPAETELPSIPSIFCGEQFVSYILVSLHGTHKSLFMRQWASCCPWGCVCYNGALVTFLKGRFSRSALKYLQTKCYGVLDLFQNNLSLGVGEACAGV